MMGSADVGCTLKDALWSCSKAFASKSGGSKQAEYRRIWLFTNDDNPCGGEGVLYDQTLIAAKDSAQMGIELSLWHMNCGSKAFDVNKYYKKLLTICEIDESLSNDEELRQELFLSFENRLKSAGNDGFRDILGRIIRKVNKKRRLCVLPLVLGKDKSDENEVNMAVQLYKIIRILDKPIKTPLVKSTSEAVKVVSTNVDRVTGAAINDFDIVTCVEIGDHKVPFDKADVAHIKAGHGLFSPGIYMLSFVSKEILFRTQNVEASYFLYPDEASVKGSRVLFKSILDDMSRKGLVALAKYVKNKISEPRLCMIVPQEEEIDSETNQQISPPGFHLIFLPFLDDIRSPPIEMPACIESRVNDTMLTAAKNIIKEFHFPPNYSFKDNLSNIAVQKFYSSLQAVALQSVIEDIDIPKDTLEMNQKSLLKEDIDTFSSILRIQADKVAKEKKPRAPAKPKGEPAAKKAKL
jgi:ATP-dependent DNA helicase 2 subunit 1